MKLLTVSAVVRLHLQLMAVGGKKSVKGTALPICPKLVSTICGVGPGICNCQGKSSCHQQWFCYSEDSKIGFLIMLS